MRWSFQPPQSILCAGNPWGSIDCCLVTHCPFFCADSGCAASDTHEGVSAGSCCLSCKQRLCSVVCMNNLIWEKINHRPFFFILNKACYLLALPYFLWFSLCRPKGRESDSIFFICCLVADWCSHQFSKYASFLQSYRQCWILIFSNKVLCIYDVGRIIKTYLRSLLKLIYYV